MLNSDSWHRRIDATRKEEELVEVIRAYCRAWLPSDLEMLPAVFQSVEISTAIEIAHLAVDLKRAEFSYDGADEGRALLSAMSQTFAQAAERLRVFHHPATRA